MDPFAGKRLTELTLADVQRLVDDSVSEGLYLDYKETLSLDDRDEKKEFLRDVTAFANTEGGLLVYGICEERDAQGKHLGTPEKVVGNPVGNVGQFTEQVENLLRDGIDERLPRDYEIKVLPLSQDSYVLLLRIPPSLRAPHMVILGGDNRFYTRTNAGKQQMSTAQVRDSTLRTDAVEQRVSAFVEERLVKLRRLANGEPFWTLHLIPFSGRPGAIDVTDQKVLARLRAMQVPCQGYSAHCVEGYKLYSLSNTEASDRAIIFRNGTVEFFTQLIVDPQKKLVELGRLVVYANNSFGETLLLYREGYLQPPLIVSLAVHNVAGCYLPGNTSRQDPVLAEGSITPSPLVMTDVSTDPRELMQPLFDIVWNAFGQRRCEYYDNNGKYTLQKSNRF